MQHMQKYALLTLLMTRRPAQIMRAGCQRRWLSVPAVAHRPLVAPKVSGRRRRWPAGAYCIFRHGRAGPNRRFSESIAS